MIPLAGVQVEAKGMPGSGRSESVGYGSVYGVSGVVSKRYDIYNEDTWYSKEDPSTSEVVAISD